jgi:hypothetical protein
MRTRSIWMLGALLIAGLFLGSATSEAQVSLGISGGIYQPEEGGDANVDTTEVFGIRGGYRFRPTLGFEASLSRLDLADTLSLDDGGPAGFDFDFDIDLTNVDLSLQWFPGGGSFVVFGGPGVSRIATEVTATIFGETLSDSNVKEIFTAHAGLGYEWLISDRFFIRPEARVRRFFDDEEELPDEDDVLAVTYEGTDYEASLVFGWRFDS